MGMITPVHVWHRETVVKKNRDEISLSPEFFQDVDSRPETMCPFETRGVSRSWLNWYSFEPAERQRMSFGAYIRFPVKKGCVFIIITWLFIVILNVNAYLESTYIAPSTNL